ncbi:hypothetical protein E2320_022950 [Naja naja]|nr:hypothetical protein E2320_022950 [Naja naja]
MLGRTQFSQKLSFDAELSFEKHFIVMFPRSSDFEKHFLFMFPTVENIENPHHFWIRAFPEELAQGISQNVGLENVENIHHLWIRAFPEELSQGISQNEWKMMKIQFIFGSKLSLRSYPKAYLKMLGRTEFSQET